MLNLHEIHVFLAAAENSNFSDAARHLHLSQPAVSQTIQSLEKYLNVNLFDRKGRRVELSDAGQALVPLARELLAKAQRVEETMGMLQGVITGQILMGCSTGVGKYLLPSIMREFHRCYPQVRFDVTACTRDTVMDLLVHGDIHMVFCSSTPKHTDLEAMPIYEDELCLIVPVDHVWAEAGVIQAQDLVGVPFIGRDEESGSQEIINDALATFNIRRDMLNTVMTLSNVEAAVLAVEHGMGVSIVSRFVAQRSADMGRIAFVDIEGVDLHQTIYIARNQRLPITLSQMTFWDFLEVEHRHLFASEFKHQQERELAPVMVANSHKG